MSGEAIVMIPPMMCDARVFEHQVVNLSRRYAVMIAPLSGGERMEELASVILTAAPQRFALVGAGLGGMVALEIMRRASERVTRLALIGTSAQSETPENAASREPQIISARAGRWEDVMRAQVEAVSLAEGPKTAEVGRMLTLMARAHGPDVFVRQARALQRRRDQQATVRGIKQQTLVICGEQDKHSPVKRHQFLAELLPNATLTTIAEAGAVPTLEAPQIVTDALAGWMA